MTRLLPGISLGLMLALASAAEAKTVSIDFTGASPVAQGLTLVTGNQTKDGAAVIVRRGGQNVAMTGNTGANHYLYFAIDPSFKQGLKSVWLTVEYFDEGKDSFQVQYDAQSDAHAPRPTSPSSTPTPRRATSSRCASRGTSTAAVTR